MEVTKTVTPAPRDAPPKQVEDPRWRRIHRTMRLHGYRPDALIETLHVVQETFGYLDLEVLKFVARSIRVPLSRVYAVATFYHFFTLKPPGRHACVVCLGTACYIGGASNIVAGLRQKLGIEPGETTPDNAVSLVTARCIGSCGLAPAVVFDGDIQGKMTPADVLERVERWTSDDTR